MKELENFIKSTVNFNSEESIQLIISNLILLSDISQPQYVRKAAFLGYTTLANVLLRIAQELCMNQPVNSANSGLSPNKTNPNSNGTTSNAFNNSAMSKFNLNVTNANNTFDGLKIISTITVNILMTFKDNDPRVVCSAAESLYNIMKYFPDFIMNSFNDIFKGLLLITVNPDQEVRTLANNLDSLLKEIVNFSFQDNQLYIFRYN